MRVETTPYTTILTAPEWFNLRDLKKIARLARRLDLMMLGPAHDLRCKATIHRSRVWRARWGRDDEGVKRVNYPLLTIDGNEWDGDGDGNSHVLLDLIEMAGFDAVLYSQTYSEDKGYCVQLVDDDGCEIETLAYAHGETRTLAAAAMCVWVERLTRPRAGAPRWGPRRNA